MSMINFSVSTTLNKMIDKTMKQKGYASKAEFFRAAALKEVAPSSSMLSLAHLKGALQKAGTRVTQKEIDQAVKQVRST